MTPIARFHLRSATVYALAAMVVGIAMGVSQDFRLTSAHSHLLLLGWVTTFLAGLFQVVRPLAGDRLARWHLVASHTGLILLVFGVGTLHLGMPAGGPLVAIGSFVTAVGMLLFMGLVFTATREEARHSAMAR